MWLDLELAVRFLRRRSGVLLRGTALAALVGVALATAALVVTLALMSGYSAAISTALQTGNAHMVGFSPRALNREDGAAVAASLAAVNGVRRATPITYLTGLVHDPAAPSNPVPVVLKAASEPPPFTGLHGWPEDDDLVAIVGIRLAANLGLEPGATAVVRLPPKAGSWVLPTLRLKVVNTFHLAFAEFDERWIIVPLHPLLEAVPETGVAGVEVELDDPMRVGERRRELEAAAPDLLLTDWRELNAALFAALRWQTLSLFVVLSLVVAVASFQVSSALVVLAIDKRRTTGMLQALGATPARVRRVLVLAGALLGGGGVVVGMLSGCLLSLVFTVFEVIRFPEDLARVYMVDHIPLLVQPLHLAAVVAICMLLVVLATLGPAWKSSRMDPVTALKAV